MNKIELTFLAIALNVAFFGLFYVMFLRDSEPEKITIYLNGTPLRVSVDGHGLESAGGHNYETGIIYEMRRNGKDVIINTKYDPTPPQPVPIKNLTMDGYTINLDAVGSNDTIILPGLYAVDSLTGKLIKVKDMGFEIIKGKQ